MIEQFIKFRNKINEEIRILEMKNGLSERDRRRIVQLKVVQLKVVQLKVVQLKVVQQKVVQTKVV